MITVTTSGGTGSLNYSLLEDAVNTSGQTTGIFTNLRAGSFRARITDTNNCLITTAPIIVTQPAGLAITINKSSNYNGFDISCASAADGEITVTTTTGGAAGYTYVLDGFLSNTSGNLSGVYSGLTSGLYSVTVTDANGCTKQSIPVSLADPLPLFEGIIGSDRSICIGIDPASLMELAPVFGGIGNYVYQWQESTNGVSFANIAGATTAIYDPPAISQTMYYRRRVTSGTCTTLTSNIMKITVNPLPTIALAPSKSPICEGESFVLNFTFTGQAPFFFNYNDGTTTFSNVGAATTPVRVTNYLNTTTFTITSVRDFNGCVAPVLLLPPPLTVPVIKINPDFTIESPSSQCSGSLFRFSYTVDPDVEYTWIWGDGEQDIIAPNSLPNGVRTIDHTFNSFNTNSDTNFPVTLKVNNILRSCGPAQTSKNIVVYQKIITNIWPDKTEICGGDNVTFSNATQGATTHRWFYRTVGSGTVTDPRNSYEVTYNLRNTSTTNPLFIEVVYEASNANCSAEPVISPPIPIKVYREVVASFNEGVVPRFNNGSSYFITYTNTSTPFDLAQFKYDWTFGIAGDANPVTLTQTNALPIQVAYNSPGTKTVVLTITNLAAGSSCKVVFSKDITILLDELVAEFEIDPKEFCFPGNIKLKNVKGTGLNHTWTVINNETGASTEYNLSDPKEFKVSSPGKYSITYRTGIFGGDFKTVGPKDVLIYDRPLAHFDTRPDIIYVPDAEMYTFNHSNDADRNLYLWNFGDGGTSDLFEPKYTYAVEGNYEVSLIAKLDHGNGVVCADTTKRTIIAKQGGQTKIPNVFTPNPDGPSPNGKSSNGTFNDIFLPIVKGLANNSDAYNLQIFDRWGNLIFESTSSVIGWDGYNRDGKLMPAGVYVYKLTVIFSDSQRSTRVGDITMIR
ncbi:MAG: PKD domain-containing protein [Cyclobacteriaceae bacterium]|nr:PKD domain-containing protein [Cyclobacteriaceae bacterium]